jgi:hypothetical protein
VGGSVGVASPILAKRGKKARAADFFLRTVPPTSPFGNGRVGSFFAPNRGPTGETGRMTLFFFSLLFRAFSTFSPLSTCAPSSCEHAPFSRERASPPSSFAVERGGCRHARLASFLWLAASDRPGKTTIDQKRDLKFFILEGKEVFGEIPRSARGDAFFFLGELRGEGGCLFLKVCFVVSDSGKRGVSFTGRLPRDLA